MNALSSLLDRPSSCRLTSVIGLWLAGLWLCDRCPAQNGVTEKPARHPARKPVDGPPQVISSEKYRDTYLPRNEIGDSRSGRPTTSPHSAFFFGTPAPGETFVFVIDNSSSMLDGGRLSRAHSELRSSIGKLNWPQKFHVIAFDHTTLELPWGPYVSARTAEARRVGPWLASLEQGDATMPGQALRIGLGLKPDAVFFLTDGEFDDPSPDRVRAWNNARVPIHIVDLGPGAPVEALRRIASDSGGTYRKVR